jgi:hypothetical protein
MAAVAAAAAATVTSRSQPAYETPARAAMWRWTDDAVEHVHRISRHADAEVEYRFRCTPSTYPRCVREIAKLCGTPPKKTVDTILTFVGNVRVHCEGGRVGRIETKQVRLSAVLVWGGLEFGACVAAERRMDPFSTRAKALRAAAEQHLAGPRTHQIAAAQVAKWALQPIAVQSGANVEWLHRHCAAMRWRMASRRERVCVNEPYSDRATGIYLPFAAVVATLDRDAQNQPAAEPALEAPIMVRHRSRHRFEFVDDRGERFWVDCTSAVEVHAKAKPHLTVEIEAARPRGGQDALWLPDDVVTALADAVEDTITHAEREERSAQ